MKFLLILVAVVLVAGLLSQYHEGGGDIVHIVKTATKTRVAAHMSASAPVPNPFAKSNGQHCRTNSQCKSRKCNIWHCAQ